MPHFVEIILVELPDEARKVAMFEVLGKDVLGKLFVLVLSLAARVR
jgi:hypothetical protein